MEKWTFDRTADHVVLDFANSVSRRLTPQPIERIPSYADLIEFARQTELLPKKELDSLAQRAAADPEEAERVHAEAIALRNAMYSIFRSITESQKPEQRDVDVLNEHLGKLHLSTDFDLRCATCDSGLDAPLDPLVLSALELLTRDRERVRMCAAPTCAFLFLDTSKNKSRRWCDMKQCGNREKDRKSTRLNSSHLGISYAVFCL